MRDFKNMKRQRGRNRSGNQMGGKQPQNANRAFDSNGPDNIKIRGHAQHVYEKYQQLARDASTAGDRVLAENYLQHAEHYFRTIRALQPNRPATEIVTRDSFTSGFDIDFEDETMEAAIEAADALALEREANGGGTSGESEPTALGQGGQNQGAQNQGGQNQGGSSQGGQGGSNQGGQNQGYQGGQGQNRDRWENRPPKDQNQNRGYQNDRPREDRYQNDRPRNDQQPREDRYQNDRPRNDQQPREDRYQGERVRNNDPRDQQRPREDRPAYEDRGDRPRYESRPRNDQSYRDRDNQNADRQTNERQAPDRQASERQVAEKPSDAQVNSPVVAPASEGSPAPKASGRMLRSDAGDVSHAPAFLQTSTAPPAAPVEEGEVRKPRRRRTKAEMAGESSEG